MPLYSQHQIAVNHFLMGKTKKDAMLIAGYSESYASKQADHVFNRDDVLKEIDRRHKKLAKKSEVTSEWIIERLKNIADANIGDIIEIQEDGTARYDLRLLTPELSAAMGEMSVDVYTEGRGPNAKKVKRMKIKQLDKLRALEMLARHLGLFSETLHVKGELTLVERLQRGRSRAGRDEDEKSSEGAR